MIETLTKSNVDFEASPIKRDIDRNCYNNIMATILDLIVVNSKLILKYPSFKDT